MMKLPKWKDLLANFPDKDADVVFTEIGGKVKFNFDIGVFNNACAVRVSKALNGSGLPHAVPYYTVKGPSGKAEVQVSSGGLKNWYIFRVKILIKYLTEKYGEPKKLSPSDYKRWLKGKKGIIIFEVSGWDDATGHADLWNGKESVGADYGGKASRILFWEAL